MEETLTCNRSPFSQVFGRQGQLMQARLKITTSYHNWRYFFINTSLSWNDAKTYCTQHHDHLVTIRTRDENDELSVYPGGGWIGLSDLSTGWKGETRRQPNSWRWSVHGTSNEGGYHNWAMNAPDNVNSGEHCGIMQNSQWDDAPCEQHLPFVCSNGSKELVFVPMNKTWSRARSHCRHHYTGLAVITSEEENTAVASVIPHSATRGVWMGLFRHAWYWARGGSGFSNWAPGQPDNNNSVEHCVLMDAEGQWTDADCFLPRPFFCQQAVQSLNNLNDQIASFIVTGPKPMEEPEEEPDSSPSPPERESMHKSMTLMRHLLVDAQAKIVKMMDDNKQLAQRIDGAIQSASQEVTNLRSELSATSRRLAELGANDSPSGTGSASSGGSSGSTGNSMEGSQHNHNEPSPHHRQKAPSTDLCYKSDVSSLMDFNSPDASLDKVLLREEVAQLQEEVQLLRQMKDMLSKDLEETQGGCSADLLSATELRVQLVQKEEELDRAKEALQAMKSDRKRLKVEKADLVNQMQQLYATLESREEQLRDFIRNYEQHRKESEDAVKTLAKEKDMLEREKWDLRRQTKEATEHTALLRSQLDLKDNRIKELEAELAMMSNCVSQRVEYRISERDGSPRFTVAKQSLATLTKDVPKRHSVVMPTEAVVNGNNQEWVMQADLPLTAAIRQSQQTLYVHTGHPIDRQVAAVRLSPCHSRQPPAPSDASAVDTDRSSTPTDLNSPRHRTHSLCNSLEDLEEAKRKKKKEKMGLGSLSRVFTRGKQRKSLDPGLFDDSDSLSSPTRHSLSLSDGSEDQLDRLQQVELARSTPMSLWRAGTVQAWLEVVMAMPMYVRTCSENVKSGKVLLGLTDEDLEVGLGVTSLMHRRKLRLAIEDYRDAENGKGLSKAADMDHHWVAKAWLSDVGLPQYSQAFHTHLVDGRMLNSLTRHDLERHLGIGKKCHQVSVLLGIELLHLLNFDKEALQARRLQCEHQNMDPLVWTSHRVVRWIRDIDLKEFAENLLNSGVHGAVMVLDPTFNTETMATALCIPGNKHMVRRHLVEELKNLIGPARAEAKLDFERLSLGTPPTPMRSSLQRQHSSGRHSEDEGSLRRRAVKPPSGFSPKARNGRDLSCHGSFGSLPRDQTPPTADGSPIRGYTSIEVTNV